MVLHQFYIVFDFCSPLYRRVANGDESLNNYDFHTVISPLGYSPNENAI